MSYEFLKPWLWSNPVWPIYFRNFSNRFQFLGVFIATERACSIIQLRLVCFGGTAFIYKISFSPSWRNVKVCTSSCHVIVIKLPFQSKVKYFQKTLYTWSKNPRLLIINATSYYAATLMLNKGYLEHACLQ